METTENNGTTEVDTAHVDCPFCAEKIKIAAKKCRHCGETVDVSMRKAEEALRASERSRNVYMNAAVSAPTVSPVYSRPEKNRGVAIVLALFLGGFGIHKFYLNRPVWGFIYLVFCWTFIPAIIAFIEAIVYLGTSDQSFHHKYG